MSAFILDTNHIDYLVNAAITLNRTNRESIRFAGESVEGDTADAIGRALWQENVASVAYRYPGATFGAGADHGLPGPANVDHESLATYRHRRPRGIDFDPVVTLSALACYEYQSCEHPTWRESAAARFCDHLRAAAIRALPGYEDAPWEITEPRREGVAA